MLLKQCHSNKYTDAKTEALRNEVPQIIRLSFNYSAFFL